MDQRIIVSGSIAYDHIMLFDGSFKDYILPEELDNLSVSFLTKDRDLYFGGCSTNIAYNLKLLNEDPDVYGVAGDDFARYAAWLEKNGISTEHIAIDDTKPTAAAYIITDGGQRQIAAFSPAAMESHDLCEKLEKFDLEKYYCAMITPDMPDRMVNLAQECMEHSLPYMFDPGQAITALSPEYLELMINGSLGVIVNEYESDLLERRLRKSIEKIAYQAGFLIVTLGKNGARVLNNNKSEEIPAVDISNVVDVTGCGDAFRAGFVHGLKTGKGLKDCCQMGNTAASFAIEHGGTQNHSYKYEEFTNRLEETYGA